MRILFLFVFFFAQQVRVRMIIFYCSRLTRARARAASLGIRLFYFYFFHSFNRPFGYYHCYYLRSFYVVIILLPSFVLGPLLLHNTIRVHRGIYSCFFTLDRFTPGPQTIFHEKTILRRVPRVDDGARPV